MVPKGVSLTIQKNTLVKVRPSDSTKTDPEYMSPLVEITVRGKILVKGEESKPVVFRVEPETDEAGLWAGIIVDGGKADVNFSTVSNSETAFWIIEGEIDLKNSTLTRNR